MDIDFELYDVDVGRGAQRGPRTVGRRNVDHGSWIADVEMLRGGRALGARAYA